MVLLDILGKPDFLGLVGLSGETAAKDIQVTLVWMGLLDILDKRDLMGSVDSQEMLAVQELLVLLENRVPLDPLVILD
jgi:hypothetical protein